MKKQRTRRRRAAIIAGIAVLAVATAVLARYAASHVRSSVPESTPEAAASSAPPAAHVATPAVRRAHNAKAAIEKPKPTPVVTTTVARAEVVPPPAAAAAPAVAPKAMSPMSATAAMPPAADQLPVTITGCLETTVDEAQFRLTDTDGADAPQARSWRSGFLKKHPAPVPLVEVSDPHGLRKFVGRRVVATGLLTGGELRVRSLRPAGASCN